MADSDITGLPPLVGIPQEDDNLVIDDVSDGVNTRTKKVEVKDFFDGYLGTFGVPSLKVDTIEKIAGSGTIEMNSNLRVEKSSPKISLKDDEATPNVWQILIEAGGAFVLRDNRFGFDVIRVSGDSADDTIVVRADSSVEFLQVVKANDYQSLVSGAALFTQGASISVLNEAVVDDGVVIDGFQIKDNHLVGTRIEGTSNFSVLFNLLDPITPAIGVNVPLIGGLSSGGTDLTFANLVRVSASLIAMVGIDAGSGNLITVTAADGQGGSVTYSMTVL